MAASEKRFRLENEEIFRNVVDFLNDEFGDDVENLSRVKSIANKLEEKKTALENKITGNSESSPNRVGNILRSAEATLTTVRDVLSQKDELLDRIKQQTSANEPQVVEYLPIHERIKILQKYLKYLQLIQDIEDLSLEIQTSLEVNSSKKAVAGFARISDIDSSIRRSDCQHMVKFVRETTQYWYTILKTKYGSDFDEILKLLKWPFIPSVPGFVPTAPYDVLLRFEAVFGILLDLHLPDSSAQPCQTNSRPKLLPLELLLKPFRKRFLYHFSGNKKTNSLDKPEWYFTQAITWINAHVGYLDRYVQPILNRAGRSQVIARVEFVRGIVEMVMAKLSSDIQQTLHDDNIVAHIINEVLAFERELRKQGYSAGEPSCLQILTQDNCFLRWLHMERKLAQSNVDKILSTQSAWSSQCQDHSDADETKVPECAEKFLTMILSITDRYKALPLPGQRLQFLELQLELIDDFRLRLYQILEPKDPLTSNFCAILNVVHYVTHVLRDWCDLPFFLQMQYYRLRFMDLQNSMQLLKSATSETRQSTNSLSCISDEEADLITSVSSVSSIHKEALNLIKEGIDESALDSLEGTVFEGSVDLFEHMKDEMINTLTSYVVMEFKAKSRPYRHEKWFSLPSPKEFINQSVSPSACGMLMVLSSCLHCLNQSLTMPIFNVAWQIIADQLNEIVYEEVILMNHFNEGGAAQLQFDMTRNLFPIFAEYARRPDAYFKKVKEACLLLNLSKGSILLLKEVLTSDDDEELTGRASTKALEEIMVYRLTKSEALNILHLRTDLKDLT